MRTYLVFLVRCFRLSFVGDWRYYLWMFLLTAVALVGLNAYARQLVHGLATTGMTDQVSWGFYIANFTFLVGMAAAAVMLVIPVYVFRNRELHDLVIFGELFAVAAIAMAMLFVTAFLYSGLGGRPFWNSAVLAPRFLASAFAAGPAFLILTLAILARFTTYGVPIKAFLTLRSVVAVALTVNMFLLGSEAFTEFYTDAAHGASARYLFLGLHGHDALVPWIWTAIALNTIALVLLYLPVSRRMWVLHVACILLIVGIWIEKGMGLIVPAFVPTPLGEIVEYRPTANEILVTLGIWAAGLLLYTIMVRITVPVLAGRLTEDRAYEPAAGAVA
jgi:molybdopterin-containing oxidoreductase family membrane subunit